MELTNCPELYAFNCKRYETYCHKCKANNIGNKLYYLPIDKSIQNHPANIKHKRKGHLSNSAKGKKNELKIISLSKYFKRTCASGSIAKDGDAVIQISKNFSIKTEIKTRLSNYEKRFTPTKAEILEGKQQGIQAWVINDGSQCSLIYIDLVIFMDIYRPIYCHPFVEVQQDTLECWYCKELGGPNARITVLDKSINKIDYSKTYFKNKSITFKDINYGFNIFINPYGRFLATNLKHFEAYVEAYNNLLIDV